MVRVDRSRLVPAAAAAALLATSPACAKIVTSLAGAHTIAIPAIDGGAGEHGKGPIAFGPGITFSSSVGSLFGFTGDYGFSPDLVWSGTPMIGLDHANGTFTLAFADPVRGFLADVASTEFATPRDGVISAYDASGAVLDSIVVEANGYVRQPGHLGFAFAFATPSIARITFANEYIGIRDISVAQAAPEPATWTLLVGGLGLVGGRMRRRQALRRRPAEPDRRGLVLRT